MKDEEIDFGVSHCKSKFSFRAFLKNKLRETINMSAKTQVGAKMEPYISGQNFDHLNQNKLTKKHKIHTMKFFSIIAVALGVMLTTSNGIKIKAVNEEGAVVDVQDPDTEVLA